MKHSAFGLIAVDAWEAIAGHWPGVELDAFVVMPNHVHGIIVILENDPPAGPLRAADAATLGSIVAYFKYQSAKRINATRDTPAAPVWQRNYHDRIVRNEHMMFNARRYIANNPARWADDVEHPARLSRL